MGNASREPVKDLFLEVGNTDAGKEVSGPEARTT